MSFTYGLSANESTPYLKLPTGKKLSQAEKSVELIDEVQPLPNILPTSAPISPAPESAPIAIPIQSN
jgi:hypothetical protein